MGKKRKKSRGKKRLSLKLTKKRKIALKSLKELLN